jgi:hypothetical protein
MKKILIISALLLPLFRLTAQEVSVVKSDQDIIMQTIQTAYVEGLQNEGDTMKINSGFHPQFDLLIPGKDGSLKKYSLTEWKERIKADLASGKLPGKPEEKVSVKFLEIDVTGNAAVAKFEFYVGEKLTFVDYQFLYKFGSEWKIVSKIYYRY